MIYPTPSPAEFEYPEVRLNKNELETLEGVLKTCRVNWQDARDDPAQNIGEDDIHDTVCVLNELIRRVTELQLTETDGGFLEINTPREMDEILFGILCVLQAISDGDVDLGTHDSDAAIAGYESLLSRFTAAHWEDNPLAEYWHEFGEHTPDSPSDPVIEAIAKHGERTHLLRELAARSNPEYSISAYENPERLDADPDDPDDIAQKFIESWNKTRESMSDQRYRTWLETTEERVGGAADLHCE